MVGRQEERAALGDALARTREGSGAIVVIRGEPGIGKTRLMAELLELADDAGHLALSGRAAQFERDVPFAVFVDALDSYLLSQGSARLETLGSIHLTELARIFPALAALTGDGGADQSERYRAHYAVGALLAELGRERPLVLALDDLQWADDASLELVAHLLRRPPPGPQLLAISYRSGEAPPRLADSIAAAARDRGLELLELGALNESESAEVLSDEVDAETLAWLFRESGGNPFYLDQLHRSRSGPRPAAVAREDDSEGALPAAVTAALASEVADLGSAARRLIEGASVAGDPFSLELAAAAAELAATASQDALDALLARQLVYPTESPRRFRFRHPIVHRAVYAGTSSGWRIGAHARARDLLAEQGAGPASLAHHVEQAAAPGDEEAIAVLERAARDSARLGPAAAANWLGAALRLVPETDSARRLDLLVPMVTALAASGRLEQSRGAVLEALELLPADASERTSLITQLATVNHLLGRRREATSVLRSELERLADLASPTAIALQIELSVSSYYGADWTGTRDTALQALEGAKAAHQPPLQASAEALVCLADLALGRIHEAHHRADAAGAQFDSLDDSELAERLDAAFHLGLAEFLLERYEDGARHGHRGVAVSRITGRGQFLTQIKVAEALSLIELGRATEAAELAEEMLEAVRLAANPQGLVWALWVWARVAGATGRLDDALRASEEALAIDAELDPSVVSIGVRTQFAAICAEAGDHARSVREMERAGAPDFQGFYPERRIRCWEALSQAALGLGEPDQAEGWVARGEELAQDLDLPVAVAVARRARSRLLLASGAPAPAAERALEAAALQGSRGARIEAARSRILAGKALGAARHPERAVAELERARAELDACGIVRYRDEAAHELRRLGRRVPRVASHAAAALGVDALSEREREIADLAAEAKTNREIAASLYISEKTVEKHLSKVFAKLGVKGRAAIGGRLVVPDARPQKRRSAKK